MKVPTDGGRDGKTNKRTEGKTDGRKDKGFFLFLSSLFFDDFHTSRLYFPFMLR